MSESLTPWIAACQASLSIMNSRSLFKLTSIESVRPCNHLILICRLLLLSSVQLLSYVRLFATPWTAAYQASLSITTSPEFTQTLGVGDAINVHRAGDAIQPSHPLSSPSPPAFSLSQHQGLFL